MTHPQMKKQIVKSLLCLTAGMGLTACVDDSYDLGKDIDMTVQLGTEGLQVRLGSTDSIKLADILNLDEEESIEEDKQNVYYLIKDGNTAFNFDIPTIKTKIDIASLVPDAEIFNYDKYASSVPGGAPDQIEIPADEVFGTDDVIVAKDVFKFQQNNIPIEVKSVKRIMPSDRTKTFHIKLSIVTNDDQRLAFVLNDMKDFKISLPYFIKCVNPSDGVTIDGNSLIVQNRTNINSKTIDLGSFQLEAVEAEGDLGKEVEINDGQRTLGLEDNIAFQGNFSIKTNNKFVAHSGDFAKVEFDMTLDGTQSDEMVDIIIDKVTGVFDPEIDPVIDPINISNDLPDFLKDEKVRMDVANPTFRFDFSMQEMPTNVDFSCDLFGVKNLEDISQVRLPEMGKTTLYRQKKNTVYYYQGNQPYDPTGKVEDSQSVEIKNLSSLFMVIPDDIRVDLSQGHVQLKQDELQTISLGKEYNANADYNVFIPFHFNNKMIIVYRDTTNGFNDKVEDLEARGATITATALNNIPLELILSGEPVDQAGNVISSIHISKANVTAADNDGNVVKTDIQLEVDLDDPAALKSLNKINITIDGSAQKDNCILTSKQYLILKDIRIKLKSPVIADLN